MGEKPLRIRFDKIDGFIKVYHGNRYLVIFDYWFYDKIYNRFRYLISEKSNITNSINHNLARIIIDLYNSYRNILMEIVLTFYYVIILIKSVVNKNKNHYYYTTLLEKGSYKDKSNTRYFQMNLCMLYMLYFDRVDVSEEIEVNKTSASKECDICHYWYFLNKGFKLPVNVCNR